MNETESIFTQLVFEHALRIRLKTDALDEKSKGSGKATKENSGESAGAATPSSVQEGSSSSADNTARGPDSSSETLVDSSEPAPEGGHAQAKAGHLVGKINNLITSDLRTISNSHHAVAIRECFAIRCILTNSIVSQPLASFRHLSLYGSFTNFWAGGQIPHLSTSRIVTKSLWK